MSTMSGGSARRVVVTGMGVVTSLGWDVQTVWNRIVAGQSGVGIIENFDSRDLPVRIASEVDAERLPVPVPAHQAALLSRSARFGLHALDKAWKDCGLDQTSIDAERLGVSIGASSFPYMEHSAKDAVGIIRDGHCDADVSLEFSRAHPEVLLQRSIPFIGTLFAHAKSARGPCLTVQTACSSANQALGEAFHIVRSGQADAMITGGTDSMISIFCVVGFTLLGALARAEDPKTASRPFDAKRNGFVLGEGAGVVVLEELEHALQRGAHIHAEVIGYGSSSDGYRLTDMHPMGRGAIVCMEGALKCANLTLEEVDYINAHGTSTPQNDRVETLAIKHVFGAHARRLAISSTKSHLGHLVCAAGGVEFVWTVMALKTGTLPPTINLENPDPSCDLDYVPNQARRAPIRVALSNSFGFGGQNGSIALRRWENDVSKGD